MDRVVLHCDCNSFFASVELLQHPELQHVPVAVCGNPEHRHGIILAKNEAAKKFRVQTAETIFSAQRKCPNLVLLPPHHSEYSRYSKIVNAIYARFTDLVEPFGIDESWLDITHSWHLFGHAPEDVAQEIRRTVKNETGLTISVGVSFNKVFAKLGSDYKKPDAVTTIWREDVPRILWPLPVGDLLYVGKSAQQTLGRLGIKTIGQLAAAEESVLHSHLGKLGSEIWHYARGEDTAPVRAAHETRAVKSVGNGLTFKRNLVGLADVKTGIYALADEVAVRLRRHGLYANAVQVQIKNTELKSISRQMQLPYPAHLAKDLGDAALQLVQAHWNLQTPIRMLTITALHLTDGAAPQQLSLLDDTPAPNAKREQLEKSMDAIREKFGQSAIGSAGILHNDLGIADGNPHEH